MKLINEVLKDKTEQGHTLDIYIKETPHSNTTPQKWVDDKTHLYVVVFHFTNVKNPNYGHSYYIDTILESSGGLCLNSTPYESLDSEKMECVRAFIEGFLITNKIN